MPYAAMTRRGWLPDRLHLGLRGRLYLLAALCVLPLFALTLVGDYLEYRTARHAAEAQAVTQARAAADDLARFLQSEITALQTLALTHSLQEGRFEDFGHKARGFLALRPSPAALRVSDPSGQAVFTTAGSPIRPDAKVARALNATGEPLVTGYHDHVLFGQPGFCIHVPVLRGGKMAWDLELALDATSLAGVAIAQAPPAGWGLMVADGDGRVLAHYPSIHPLIGEQQASAATMAIAHASTAIAPGLRSDGTPLRLAIATVPDLNWGDDGPWSVTLGVPVKELLAPLWRIAWFGVLAGSGVMVAALVLAGAVARDILQPIQRVQELAAMPDTDTRDVPTGLTETDAVAAALREAARARHDALARLQELAATLEHRVAEEVAARQTAQAQAAQGERMQALGQLASGVAHDFNNVLQTVATATHLLQTHSAHPETVQRVARLLGNAGQHGAAITGRLLGFARRGNVTAPGPLALPPVLAELREMLAVTLGSRVLLSLAVPDDLPLLLADRGQLETVLINLAVNARDAMPQGGQLTISAAPAVPPLPPELKDGRYVMLCVADNGIGIAPEVLARVTEPFFSTKPPGKGTGLGLALARNFAEHSGGLLTIASTRGAGTMVRLWLRTAA